MKQAVILVGGKQYLVSENETLQVDLLPTGGKALELPALLLIDDDKTTVGKPEVKGVKVTLEIVEPEIKGEKVRYIRYHSKKRIHTENGHRQKYSLVKVTSIK
ncbi:MAG: 50S ribosomal protein L21 [Candidatus Saccharibacteria bacterium]|nr:50S ribosomal protein L21 [Candidatus Saccharibacteria bacterium]